MSKCVVCEKELTEHNLFKNVYYCSNPRCIRLGLLTVYILEEKKAEVPANPPVGVGEITPNESPAS